MLLENNILDESKPLIPEQLESGVPRIRTVTKKIKWLEWKEPKIVIIVKEMVKGILTPREY